jgi:hypothetical protein
VRPCVPIQSTAPNSTIREPILALADGPQNISRACKVAGIRRSRFYEIKEAYKKYGREGLAPQPRGQRRELDKVLIKLRGCP